MITTYARNPKLLRTGARLKIEISERSRKRLRSNLVRASKSRSSRETKTPRDGPTAGPSHSQRREEVQEVAPCTGFVARHSAEAMSCGDGEDSDTVRAEVLPRTKQLEVSAGDGV
jgi:hypothetical protein